MSSECKTATSVAGTCKTANSAAGTCKNATAAAGTCETPVVVGNVATLSVFPAEAFETFGWDYLFQACLNPETKVYVLTNTGSSSLDWTASLGDGTYFELSSTSGTLAAGASVSVTVSYISVGPPPMGSITDLITFINVTNGNGTTTRGIAGEFLTPQISSFEIITHVRTANLVGWEEFTSPSVPPKKYLTKVCSGQVVASYYTPSDCSGSATGWTGERFTGQTSFDPNTGSPIDGVSRYAPGSGSQPFPVTWGSPTTVTDMNFPGKETNPCLTCVSTPFHRYALGNGACDTGFSFPAPQKVGAIDCSLEEILLSEDTEAAAFIRAPIVDTSYVDTTPVFVEVQGPRGAGEFSRTAGNMDYEFNLTDLLVGAKYLFVLGIITEPYGGGSQVTSEITTEFVATATTKQITGNLAPLEGERITIDNYALRCPGVEGGGGPPGP